MDELQRAQEHHRAGQLAQAEALLLRILARDPNHLEALNNFGAVLFDLARYADAATAFAAAVRLNPGFIEARSNLANALLAQGDVDQAIDVFREVLRQRPDSAFALSNLGNALKDCGRMDEAIDCYRRAAELRPDDVRYHDNLIYGLYFHPDYDPRKIRAETARWQRLHADPLKPLIRPHENDRDPRRRLRIGYVSPDFRNHAVSFFLAPLIDAHDRGGFEIHCYASVRRADEMTERLRSAADVWHDCLALSDAALAEQIRADRIDILVDLTMHMSDSRLLVFARKPTPVQVTYLAYCGTTGLEAMDYRITDVYLDPPDSDQTCYSEQSVRLPWTHWCYEAPAVAPEVNPLPALAREAVTFGCLNNFCKVSPAALSTWGRLLRAVPGSRLLLHAREGRHRQHVLDVLGDQGIDPQRVEFVGHVPRPEYFALHHRIDIALDPFPYGGGTTTCDALWMGVPVVSLAQDPAYSRAGLSLLSNVGLTELVAHSEDQYVTIASALAGDGERLKELRATLRRGSRLSRDVAAMV